jgi:hypothetical protein
MHLLFLSSLNTDKRLLLLRSSQNDKHERLENIVRAYPADKLNLLNTNTEFLIKSEESSNGALIIQHKPLLSSLSLPV